MLSKVSLTPGFSDSFYSKRVAQRQRISSGDGITILRTRAEYKSLLRPDGCSPPLPHLILSHSDLLSFPLICPAASHLGAWAGPQHPDIFTFLFPQPL